MGRLIDADELLRHKTWINGPSGNSIYDVVFCDEIAEASTVEAIPKADYENRLKADLVAMLTEIQLEIEEHKITSGVTNQGAWNECIACCSRITQQKINELRGEEDGNDK